MGQAILNKDGQTIEPQHKYGNIYMKKELAALEIIDPNKQRPTGTRILLMVASVESISPGGIILSDSAVVKEVFGSTNATLVKASAAAFVDPQTGDYYQDKPEEGDRVVTTKYPGNAYRDEEGNIYRFADDVDVVSVVEGETK